MIIGVEDCCCFEREWIDRDEVRGAVGSILRDGYPYVFSVIVDAAGVVLDVPRHCQCGVGDAAAVPRVDHHVREAGAGGTVGAIDYGVVAVADGFGGVLAAGDKVTVWTNTDDTLWLEGLVVEYGLLNEIPYCCATQGIEL